ncbi:Protein tyrosine phosphatase domain-containing protein 1 [Penaeus vannamei]|uniref:Protein tyrosine phosphatase domain-containing protein 1 n=1 Tax=Penaeus vannamei TaxID=6689 RepID=A0A423TXH6_PENVA|nr:Protein tyrosine phosphatase domain-containing protein 1 [Penaeus vannamei]
MHAESKHLRIRYSDLSSAETPRIIRCVRAAKRGRREETKKKNKRQERQRRNGRKVAEKAAIVFYYNFGLKDYGEPTQGGLLDMVKVMAFSLSEGKVAVHCHAGLGRTGVLIACYLVYALRVRANDAIRYVRMKRPNAVQTSGQIQVVQEFEQFILPQLYLYCNREFMKEKRNPEFTLHQYLHRQRTILHGYEARTLKNIPKLVYQVCERLLRLCGCAGSAAPPHLLAPLEISYTVGTPSFTSFFLSAQYDHETRVSYSAPQSLGSPALSASLNSQRSSGVRVPSEDDSGYPGGEEFSMGEVSVPSSAQYPNRRLDDHTPDIPSCMSGLPERSIDSLLNDGIRDQKLTDNSCYKELASQTDLRKQAEEEDLKSSRLSAQQVILPKEVYEAILVDHSVLNTEFKKQLKNYRIELNVKQSAWERLNTETNLYLLTGLLFTWLEHLRTPVLGVDALSYIVLASSKPEVCLRKLDKEVRYTLEYLIRFVARLQPFTRVQQEAVLRRLIASLTQQAVPVRGTLLPAGKGYTKLREGTLRKVVEFINKFFDLVYMESRSGSAVSASSSTAEDYASRVTPPGQVVTPPPDEDAEAGGTCDDNSAALGEGGEEGDLALGSCLRAGLAFGPRDLATEPAKDQDLLLDDRPSDPSTAGVHVSLVFGASSLKALFVGNL